jgi:hypothetical protein
MDLNDGAGECMLHCGLYLNTDMVDREVRFWLILIRVGNLQTEEAGEAQQNSTLHHLSSRRELLLNGRVTGV